LHFVKHVEAKEQVPLSVERYGQSPVFYRAHNK
jgi:hypothetical protein